MEQQPGKALYLFQKELSLHSGEIENARSAEEALPEIEKLMVKLRAIDLSSMEDIEMVEYLSMVMLFTSGSIARYASPEIRTEAANFEKQVHLHGWELFVREAKKRGVENPEVTPATIDANFLSYMKAVHFFSPVPEDNVRRATEIFEKIMNDELPSNLSLVSGMNHESKHIGPYPYHRLADSMSEETRPEDLPGYNDYHDLMMAAQVKLEKKQRELANLKRQFPTGE